MKDILVIGAGPNGLCAAFYLAKAGFRPLVLERRAVVGGAAVTEEFHPGFRSSILAHAMGPLRPDIARDMRLDRHGLRPIHPDPILASLSLDGPALLFFRDHARSVESIAPFSPNDARRYPDFMHVVGRLARFLRLLLARTPPSLDRLTLRDWWGLLATGLRFRALGRADAFRLLQWGPAAVADLVQDWFETDLLQATLAAPGIVGTFLGPRSAGTTAALLLQSALNGGPLGATDFVTGGLGGLTRSMASAAQAAGVEIRTGAEVTEIDVEHGTVTGVVLASGERVTSRAIVSSADPKRTLLGLLDPRRLTPDFAGEIRNYRCRGTSAKVNLALAGLPRFPSVERAASAAGLSLDRALAGRLHIGPDLDYLEQAFDAAKYGDYSPRPYLDVAIPSLTDPSLAPGGQHVMSIYVQYAPFELRGRSWPAEREALGEAVVRTLSAYAPGLDTRVLARQVITPYDLEETYGLTGGHIFHGEPALDQLFMMRPLFGWARYRTPIHGLYLCGAGTHPGGGVTGAPGANAGREIVKDLRRAGRA